MIILVIIAGMMFGPLVAHYSQYISIVIHKRDLEDNAKAIAAGEEALALPEGMNLFKNQLISRIIIIVICGILWGILYFIYGMSIMLLIYGLTTVVLLSISIVDFQVFEIPIECNIIILVLGIVNLLLNLTNWLEYLIGFLAVSLVFLIIALLTKGKAMGGGDIKLMATLGFLFGWKQIILIMVLGSLLGSIIHGLRMILSKKNSVLAFGPYLSMAAYIAICFGDRMINAYLNLFPQI